MKKQDLIITTKYGKVQGFEENRIVKWFGIPYAKPPVEELRFKRAQEPEPWTGIKTCLEMGRRPYQFTSPEQDKLLGSNIPMSEDCLNLNIWAPAKAQKKPVFVWIYGGANHLGEASIPTYSLDSFAKKDIVSVSFNYRLGPLGFYNFSTLDNSFDSNCAISDMIQAMHWIKENIEAFGGDSNNITVAGESAGGTAVYSLLTAPLAHNTFNKAIAMSGLAGNVTTQKTQDLNNQLFFDKLGIAPTKVAKLKSMPVEKMIPAGTAVMSEGNMKHPGIFKNGPVIDDLLPQKPWEALANGVAKDKICIFGTCHDEGTLYYQANGIPRSWQQVEKMLKDSGQLSHLGALKNLYQELPEQQAMEKLGRDRLFWADSIKATLTQSQVGTVYSYRYDFTNDNSKLAALGAFHGSDVQPALNSNLSERQLIDQPKLKKARDTMHNAFVNFVINGDPNGDLPLTWPKYEETRRATFIANERCSIENNPTPQNFEVWKNLKLYE